jgi:transcriptional regulator GlxA family with amidase domain
MIDATKAIRIAGTQAADPFRVGIVLLPGFSLMAFAATVEPLRSANLMREADLYCWTYLSPDSDAVTSSGGLPVATDPLPGSRDIPFDCLILCGGLGCERYRNRSLANLLRRAQRAGSLIGSISTASFILARAGLLQDRRCTLHWDYLPAFREAFPEIDVVDDLFVFDGNICTCAGGVAALDMMLHLIRQRQDAALAALVSDQFIHGSLRQARDDQRMELPQRLGTQSAPVAQAVALMEANIEQPLAMTVLIDRLHISGRQLERLFRHTFGLTPVRYYLNLRLDAARKLLQLSTLTVLDIALACGFVSAAHFTKTYRLHFGRTPSRDRRPAATVKLTQP